MNNEKIAVFMTAFNEEHSVGEVLSKIDKTYDIYLVDDGSTDRTPELAREYGAQVISHSINLGQGLAFITGLKLLSQKGYKTIVHIDSDGQHDPREISIFVDKIIKNEADVVAGSRILGSNYKGAPFARRFFLPPLTWVLSRITGYNITDFMCGFRAFNGEALKRVDHLFDNMIEPEYTASEMWIKFAATGLKVTEAPVYLKERKHGFSYKGLFKYGRGVISAIIRAKLEIYKYKYKK